jgi:hypothetical protein
MAALRGTFHGATESADGIVPFPCMTSANQFGWHGFQAPQVGHNGLLGLGMNLLPIIAQTLSWNEERNEDNR